MTARDTLFRHTYLSGPQTTFEITPDGRQFLMQDQFTSADILLTTCLTWAVDYGVGICDSAQPYLQRIVSRPAYKTASDANKARETATIFRPA